MTFRSWLVSLVALTTVACSDSDATQTADPNAPRVLHVAVIPKGTTHVFWKAVESGARDAEKELGIRIEWKGPLKENDRAQQIQLVEQFVSQGLDGIAIAPLDHQALVAPLAAATRAKLPVVIFDSDLDGTPGVDFASFVATDNLAGGRLGGEHLATLLGGEGKVVLLRYQVGSASTDAREKGFLEALAISPKIEVLVDNRYAGATAGEAKTEALNLLAKLHEANGIFCSNESATMGMLLALRQAGLAGKVRFVGFDASPPLVEALKSGEIDALVLQNPRKMGYLATKTLVAAIRGEKVEPRIDTGVVVATRQNLNDPAIAPLLQ
ncbi:MAG: substrate-binding domain-containing protein [Planctomycetes bacterium]|nr:substrate-binding domain-containing protein [Planctomycetota bacterium]